MHLVLSGLAEPDLSPLADACFREVPDNLWMESTRPEAVADPVGTVGDRIAALEQALREETAERRRAECMGQIQDQAAQLALDLIVTEPDIAGFFAEFTRKLVEETESRACGVWLVDDDRSRCDLWLAHLHDRLYTPGHADWADLALPRDRDVRAPVRATARAGRRRRVYSSHDRAPAGRRDSSSTSARASRP